MRIGHGYDVHRFSTGRRCVLCGIEVPFAMGPDGHSDADVPIHALMDALLGAAALGDIGLLFPDNDDRFLGIDSMILLKNVVTIIMEKGFSLSNVDITIITQQPKLRPYIESMRECLSDVLDIEKSRISVKATTEEGLGFTGSLEGIAAHAVVLLNE